MFSGANVRDEEITHVRRAVVVGGITMIIVALLTGGCSLLVSGPGDHSLDASDGAAEVGLDGAFDGASSADAHRPACDPFDGACGCCVDNDPLGGPACGTSGTTALCESCETTRECGPSMFCTGYVGSPGSCRALCGGPDNVACSTSGTCVSVYWDGFDWWGYCPGSC